MLGAVLPDFPVLCRRLTPAPGYLSALTRENVICPSRIVVEHFSDSPHIQVKYITSTIAKVTEDGIETEDGQLVKQDIIICATGMKFNQNVSVILGLDLLKQDSMRRFCIRSQ